MMAAFTDVRASDLTLMFEAPFCRSFVWSPSASNSRLYKPPACGCLIHFPSVNRPDLSLP
jgi:hypothetical protein